MNYSNEEILILAIGALGLGMYLLFKGGNWTIDSAVYLARKFGVSPLVIGFTIVAFGTSLPELIVSVNAHLSGSSGIAIGNVIGSNIANILFVIGVTTFFSTLFAVPRALIRDIIMMLLASLLMMAFMLHGQISQMMGILMIGTLATYVVWQYMMASKGKIQVEEIETPKYSNFFQGLIFLILGLACISLGAEFLVRGAKVSASIIGVPEDVIGLSVIALGTSLPELSTCVIAAMKRHSDLVIGNVLGSNVFNILMIIGVTATVKPIEESAIAPQVLTLDIWVMLGVSVLFSIILLMYKKVNRPIGFIFVLGYLLYIGLIYALYLTKDVASMVHLASL
ncbi:MAG TPA: calcium/sodium antiporter [Alphaproteobacteria bacterium]|nr:calcium/sodium antiporter [Alphaproteobacteria bacterium]